MKRSVILLAISSYLGAYGQTSYVFEQNTETFAHLANATVCSFGNNDLYEVSELDGETFWFFDVPFTFGGSEQIFIHANGGLLITSGTSTVLINGLFADLIFADVATNVQYTITGNSGEKVLAVEWKDWGIDGPAFDPICSWVIELHQSDGLIEFHYTRFTNG